MTATDTTPVPAFSAADEPDDYGTPPMVSVDESPRELPPAQDTKPSRPTTRAGRAAAKRARAAASSSGTDAKPKATTKPTPRKGSLDKRLTTALVSVGGMVVGLSAATGSEALSADGLVIIQNSANMAEAINRVADEDPRVKAALERMLTAGAWSGVLAAVLPVVLAIAGNHGAIPPQLAAMFATIAPPAEAGA